MEKKKHYNQLIIQVNRIALIISENSNNNNNK